MVNVYNHSTLNPKIWLSDNNLRPDVAEILTRIYISFMTVLSTYSNLDLDLNTDIIDVVLCGSCVGYNYKKDSDIDISIILRPDRYLKSMDGDIFDALLDFVRTFFVKKYNPKISGLKVDISTVPTFPDYFSRYSLLHKAWLKEPRKFSKDEIQHIQYRADLYYRALKRKVLPLLKDKRRHADGMKMLYEIRNRRAESWNEDLRNMAPYSIAYSQFSRDGYTQKLSNVDRDFIKKMIMNINAKV